MYEHAVGEFFLTFSSCQLWSVLPKENADQPKVFTTPSLHSLFFSGTTKPQQSRLTFCNWQTLSTTRKVKNKTSLVTFGCRRGFRSYMRNQIQLVGARAGRLYRDEWHKGKSETERTQGRMGLIPIPRISAFMCVDLDPLGAPFGRECLLFPCLIELQRQCGEWRSSFLSLPGALR